MKKSINAWSVPGDVGFEKTFADISRAGFDGIELNLDGENGSAHSLKPSASLKEVEKIRALSEKYGLPVVSVSSSLYDGTMGSADESVRKFAKDTIKKQIEFAEVLGAKGVLTVPGGTFPKVPYIEDYKASYETLAEIRDFINEKKIYVGVENVWNGFFASPFDMAEFIDAFDCPYIRAYYDVGNVVAFSWSERWIEVLGKRIRNVHIKDFKRNGGINSGGKFVDLLKGDVDWKKTVAALKNAGFDGYLTAEVFKCDSDDPDKSDEEFYRSVLEAENIIINSEEIL